MGLGPRTCCCGGASASPAHDGDVCGEGELLKYERGLLCMGLPVPLWKRDPSGNHRTKLLKGYHHPKEIQSSSL